MSCCQSALHSIDKEDIVLVFELDGSVASIVGMPLLLLLVLEGRWKSWGESHRSCLLAVV